MSEYDAVIVGAGIFGLATAYHIKRMKPQDKILVVDKLSAAGQGNTAKSAAMFRCFFYSRTNLTLVDTSVEFYRHVHETLKVDLKLKWTGYLWLFSEEDYKTAEPVLKSMRERGLEYKIFEEKELAEKLKMNTHVTSDEEAQMMGLADANTGVLVPKAGSIDIDELVKFYETEFKRMGGQTQYNTRVEGIIVEPENSLGIPGEPYFWQSPHAAGVKTNKGIIKAKKTIVAAGTWASVLLDQVGIDTPSKPIKRQLFSVRANTEPLKQLLYTKGFTKENCMPFTILPKPRVYIKPALEEEAFWFSYGDHFPRAFKLEDDPQPEENFYKYGIYQVATKYFPQFVGTQPHGAWAGQYALNTLDGQPVIFEEDDVIVVGSCSGSGNMKADAVGRIAAAIYAGEETALLYGEKEFKVSDLGIKKRNVEPEKLII
ncbi:MAG: FAD-binding oxidoreductase [Candidatus Bathyarchaeia archaeon]